MSPSEPQAVVELPPIPAKRYFTIGEVSDLCGVKPHVLLGAGIHPVAAGQTRL